MTTVNRTLIALAALAVATFAQSAPKPAGNLFGDLRDFVQTPSVSGYEQALTTRLATELKAYSPTRDNYGDVLVTVGAGSPHRLIAAPLDEPGYVVSGITPDGYLRLERLPTRGNFPLFNELNTAEPVVVGTTSGGWINGVISGLSTHLQPGRIGAPDPNDIDNIYVDLGATSPAQVRAAGVDILSPVLLDRKLYAMAGGEYTAPSVGDRFGAAAAVEVLRRLDPAQLKGTVTVAFVTEQWTNQRGLARVLEMTHPDEVVYVGRLSAAGGGGRGGRGGAPAAPAPAPGKTPGAGVLIAAGRGASEAPGLGVQLGQFAQQAGAIASTEPAAAFLPTADNNEPYAAHSAHIGIPVAWPSTPAEMINGNDLASLVATLDGYLGMDAAKPSVAASEALPEPAIPARPASAPTPTAILAQMAAPYGVNPHEQRVGETIQNLLPPWAKPEKDEVGDLVLHWGTSASAHTPRILLVAHQDEIGYDVQSIAPDGRLVLRSRGGGDLDFYLGHTMLVHTATGMRPGLTELPEGWEAAGFRLAGARTPVRMDVGARTPAEVEQLGIKVGDSVTIPKQYRKLIGTRATARAFDDRVGSSSLIAATWALGPELAGRDITFVWSTGEEIGLVGAGTVAKRLAAQGKAPDYVFAIDTFVSSDSPLESHRFADTPIGEGVVIRAVDDSSIIPWPLARRLQQMAKTAQIPVQLGETGGGNDGSVFPVYGTIDIPMGWPLRYSHSPGEVIDTRDLDSLSRLVELIAHSW